MEQHPTQSGPARQIFAAAMPGWMRSVSLSRHLCNEHVLVVTDLGSWMQTVHLCLVVLPRKSIQFDSHCHLSPDCVEVVLGDRQFDDHFVQRRHFEKDLTDFQRYSLFVLQISSDNKSVDWTANVEIFLATSSNWVFNCNRSTSFRESSALPDS